MMVMNRRQTLKTLARTGLAGLLSAGAWRLIRRSQQQPCTVTTGCERCGKWQECGDEKARAYQQHVRKEAAPNG